MASAIFIGDELTAAGYRLAGIETVVPAQDDASAALRDARNRAGIVIITADVARRIATPELEAALLAETPGLAIVPDILLQSQPPDLAGRLRRILGIDQ
jgi:vacuolar-type H+-ATPase subunit F/Vma7